MKRRHILIVDDEPYIRQSLVGILSDEGYRVSAAESGEDALSILKDEPLDLLLLDVWLPGMDGLEVLETLKRQQPPMPVVMISGHANVETAVKATKLGAFDFLEKPLDMDKILLSVRNGLQLRALAEENLRLKAQQERPELTGKSPAIVRLKEAIARVAPADSWVLITGENGTGKELVAHSIHRQSPRRHNLLVDVNCAAIPEELIESELFGHEKGAFTGASAHKRGKFDLADSGTIFLDEIADMSLKTQAKILRILQEQRFERVGGTRTIEVDSRVLAATNKDLDREMAKGRFREDLYHRLNVIPLHVPPLRERPEDIAGLVEEFLQVQLAKGHTELPELSPQAMETLMAQTWSGNVRELKNLVERLVILSPAKRLESEDLVPFLAGGGDSNSGMPRLFRGDDFKAARAGFEKAYLERKLEQFGGNVSRTAEAIGLERSHLHKKLKSLGLKADKNGD